MATMPKREQVMHVEYSRQMINATYGGIFGGMADEHDVFVPGPVEARVRLACGHSFVVENVQPMPTFMTCKVCEQAASI